jgi:hypothetical protein
MTSPEKLSALTTFADVVADATRRFNAGELDTAGYVNVLLRQGFTPQQAIEEAMQVSLAEIFK